MSTGRVLLVAVLAFALAACGRKATEADCQLIVDRSVELQMKEMAKGEPEAIAKRQAQLRTELESQMKDCVGRRISDQMMTCVKGAQSSEALEGCVR
jgi:small lipoprotein (TIGR04454 family)